jgi:hypothetical protein
MTDQPSPTTIPILSATDFDAAARFYGTLGFVETGRWGDYLILVHPVGIELHFMPEHDVAADHHHAGACYIRFDTADGSRSLHDAWAASAPSAQLTDPRPTPYGLFEFDLADPFGNALSIGGAMAATSP